MLALSLLAVAAGDASAHWRDATYSLASLPSELPDSARSAIERWSSWAGAHELGLWLSDDGSVLLVHDHGDEKEAKKKAKRDDWPPTLVRRTLEEFDRLAQDPPKRDEAAEWDGKGEVAVLLQGNDQKAYEDAIAEVVRDHDYLSGWSATASNLGGFVLQKPLVASWPSELPKVDMWDTSDAEWDSANELVHRLAQLLLTRRFGTQPYWLQVGVAWWVEERVRDTFFCFPYRDGFVSTYEHDGWDSELRGQFKKADFDLATLAGWRRGTFDPELAHQAWGVVRWMAQSNPGALSLVLDDLRLLRASKGKVTQADGTWEVVPDYEVTVEDQRAVFAERLGDDCAERVTAAFRKGLR